MPPTEDQIATAALAVASTITVADVENIGNFFAKLLGGHAQAADWHQAQHQATETAIDIAEEVRISQEPGK